MNGYGSPDVDDAGAMLEKVVVDSVAEIRKLHKEVVTQMFPRPIGSTKVNSDEDFNEWIQEDFDAKREWLKQKAQIVGVPRAATMFVEREARNEKKLNEIPVSDETLGENWTP